MNFRKGPANAAKSFALTNSGTEALSVTVGNPANAAFSVVAVAGPATLGAGQSETVRVQYAPTAAGSFSDAIAISSDATKGKPDTTVKLKGSATGSPSVPTPSPTPTPGPTPVAGFSGSVLGGLSPISGASVSLYAVGDTGYGSAPVQLSATSTDGSGSFTIPAFICPAGSPETYLIAIGGDAGSGANSAIGLAAVLGPCDNLSPSTVVTINELTTVAAAWGLSQFSDPTGQNFGTSSTNTTGLANAVTQIIGDLVSSATGGPAAFLHLAAACSSGSPPINCEGLERMDTDANILARCVESSGAGSDECATLLSQTGGGTTTLQAAHVMAVSPAANVSTLFALQSGSPPFTPALSSAPDGWEIALNFAPNGAKFSHPQDVAIDTAGNIWVSNRGSNSVTELTTSGGVVGNFSPKGARFNQPYNLAIDALGDVWVSNVIGNSVTELTSSGGLIGNFAPKGAGIKVPEGLAIDAAGNAWVVNTGGGVVELTSSGTLAGSFNNTSTSGANFSAPRGLAIDPAGDVWVSNAIGNSVTELTSGGGLIGNFAPAGADFDGPINLAIDGAGNIWMPNTIGYTMTELTPGGSLAGNFGPGGAAFVLPIGVANRRLR